MAEESAREGFDIENVRNDDQGIPEIPRIQFTVPRQYRKEVLQIMHDEIRSTPGELLMAIFVKYMRDYRARMESRELPEAERRQLPTYVPKQPMTKSDQAVKQNAGE